MQLNYSAIISTISVNAAAFDNTFRVGFVVGLEENVAYWIC